VESHAAQLKKYLSEQKTLPDLICVQETFLKTSSKFNIPGFAKETLCRVTEKGGGVATFIREGLAYIREPLPTDIEGITLQIKINKRDVHISNIYIRPQIDVNIDDLRNIFSRPNSIICGDLNAKNTLWGSPKNDGRGDIISDLLDECNLTVLNTGEGTFLKRDLTMSHLDLGIASNSMATKCAWEVLDECWSSDHLPTKIIYGEAPDIEEAIFRKWNFKKADWANFTRQAGEEINESLLVQSIEDSCNNLTNAIQKLAKNNIPKTNPANGKKRLVPYWNSECTAAVKNKEKCRKRMKKSKLLRDGNLYREAKAKTKYIIKTAKKGILAKLL